MGIDASLASSETDTEWSEKRRLRTESCVESAGFCFSWVVKNSSGVI
jgi:hypothetical protein